MTKIKIFNDPVYGFVRIPRDFLFTLIEHPYFQRLRRIKQLGMTNLVYPGALHTRFHHALGAHHLLNLALDTLRQKGVQFDEEECEAASIAVLLHDIGHGPFSHALEYALVDNVSHEDVSILFMERLNEEFGGRLSLALEIFKGGYHRTFLHQLVSSQLDVDRLDYLRRDSFYTGVHEGAIGSDRIIMMMNVKDSELVIEEKGILSIEKFLLARRFMYWQVYLHKTVISAEQLLIHILRRAKHLAMEGKDLFCTPALSWFLYHRTDHDTFREKREVLGTFAALDDYDIFASLKVWATSSDRLLALLCRKMIQRDLLKIEIDREPIPVERLLRLRKAAALHFGITLEEAASLVFTDVVENSTYSAEGLSINILRKDGSTVDITKASDQHDLNSLSTKVLKYFICYPKEVAAIA